MSLAAVLSFAALATIVLYRFPPAAYGFYPVCPVHAYLHLECPGCGATRALAALLHGHLMEALHLNALFVALVVPMAVWCGLWMYVRTVRGEDFRWPPVPVPAVYAGMTAVALFTVMRNL